MGTKGLIRLLIVLAIAGVIAVIAKFAGSDTGVSTVESKTTNQRTKVFADFPINDVAAVKIQSKDEALNILKKDGQWVINEREDFPAQEDRVLDLLKQMWSVKITQVVPNGAAHLARLELSDPASGKEGETATVLTFSDAEGKELTSIALGKIQVTTSSQPNPYTGGASTTDAGRYVKPGGKNSVYLVDTPFKEAAGVDPTEWITRDFFKVERHESVALDTGNPKEDWKLERGDLPKPFDLVDAKKGENLDTAKISTIKSAFVSPTFTDIYVGDEKPKTDAATLTLTSFDKLTYIVSVGEKDEENNRPLAFTVKGDFSEKREVGEEESEDDKKSLDARFEKLTTERKEKLAQEQALSKGRVFKVRSSIIDPYLTKRADLLIPPPEPETPPGVDIPGIKPPPVPPAAVPGAPVGQ